MSEPMVSQCDAASALFNLPGFRVVDAIDTTRGGRHVLIVSSEPPGCPACGVISTRVHRRTLQRVRDVPIAGAVEVIWCKRRWICAESLCTKATFAESTSQVPARARSTIWLWQSATERTSVTGRPRHDGPTL